MWAIHSESTWFFVLRLQLLRLCHLKKIFSDIFSSEKVDSSQDQDVSSDEDESVESTTETTGEDGHEAPETTPSLPTTSSSTPPSAPLNQGRFQIL